MASMVLMPIVELLIRSWPMRIHSPAWRLGMVGTAASVAGSPLLALFVVFAIALAAEDRGAQYLVASLSAVGSGICILCTGLFVLDALQMKGQVHADVLNSYGVGSTWIAVRLVVTAIMFGVLAIGAFRSASVRRTSTGSQPVKGGASVLVSSARTTSAAAPKRAPDPVGEIR